MKRVDLIKEIAAEFELIANRLSETEVATVASVVELEPQHLAEIAKRAQKLTGSKNVKLKTVIDKSLLAGIIIRYGNSGSKLSLITLRFRRRQKARADFFKPPTNPALLALQSVITAVKRLHFGAAEKMKKNDLSILFFLFWSRTSTISIWKKMNHV
ncbi:hypothetical protein SASPL_145977 [Salvia splendens]|uniref:F-type H+-transporting ATPase subunit delta n=1 Tax=Salvia splendens TaxID=180675 RepID=A0A8X8WJT9_SALSN|nr:hypothetical protein SASPL_145977 [Salvia splendens]